MGVGVDVGVAVEVAVGDGVGVAMKGKLDGSEQASAASTLKAPTIAIIQVRRFMPAIIKEWALPVNLADPSASC